MVVHFFLTERGRDVCAVYEGEDSERVCMCMCTLSFCENSRGGRRRFFVGEETQSCITRRTREIRPDVAGASFFLRLDGDWCIGCLRVLAGTVNSVRSIREIFQVSARWTDTRRNFMVLLLLFV